MRTTTRIKPYRDQGLWRDLGFLVIATAFVLVKAFDQTLVDALINAPLIVGGVFIALLGAARILLLVLRLIDYIAMQLSGGPRSPRR